MKVFRYKIFNLFQHILSYLENSEISLNFLCCSNKIFHSLKNKNQTWELVEISDTWIGCRKFSLFFRHVFTSEIQIDLKLDKVENPEPQNVPDFTCELMEICAQIQLDVEKQAILRQVDRELLELDVKIADKQKELEKPTPKKK